MSGEPRRVGDDLDRVVRSLSGMAAGTTHAVFGRWDDLVGPQIAAHARPLSLDEGRLVIGVDEPGWATQLRYLEHDLVRRIGEVLGPGVITRLDVRVKPR